MRAVLTGVFVVTLAGCAAGGIRGGRTPDVAGCDADDFATGHVVFFGLTNNLGPGTIMKRYAGKGVGPEVLVDSLVADQASPSPSVSSSTVVHHGRDWACSLGDSVARVFDANRAVGILPASDSDNAKLALASRITVTVDAVRWDDLLEGPYRAVVDHLSDAGLKTDLLAGRYLIVSRALAAKGIKVTALYDRSTGAGVKAALGDGQRSLVHGKVTAVVNLAWEGTTKLVITAPSEVYIAGQFRKFGSGRSASGDGTVEATDPTGQMLVRGGG
jgi:hypothetical protein